MPGNLFGALKLGKMKNPIVSEKLASQQPIQKFDNFQNLIAF